MSEPYRLWAIETASQKTASILSFAAADTRVILAPSINKYKEIKFYGDNIRPGGNDYEIFEDSRTVGHTVTQPSDTIDILRKLFTIL